MVKLIALDLDGTLMSADHMTVTQKTKEASATKPNQEPQQTSKPKLW